MLHGCFHSLAKDGEAPQSLARISAKGVPVNSLKLCAVILFLGSMIAYFAQERVFTLLMAVPGFVVVIVWIAICLAQLKLRKSYPVQPTFKVWGYPYLTIITTLCLSIIAVTFLFDAANRISIGVCIGVMILLAVWSIFRFKSSRIP